MSMNLTTARLRAASVLGAFCLLAACGESDESSASGELATTEAELNAADQSQADARAAAQACFETYKTCKAASGTDEQLCRDALKACLPAQAPSTCGGAGNDGGSADASTPAAPDAQVPSPSDAGATRARRGDAGDDTDARHSGRGEQCGAPHVPHDRFGACNARACTTLGQGAPMSRAEDSHKSCVAQGFEEHLTKLCAKASELCAEPGAPADICQRISSKCGAITAPGTAPDAGP